jgi:hypothetical protein
VGRRDAVTEVPLAGLCCSGYYRVRQLAVTVRSARRLRQNNSAKRTPGVRFTVVRRWAADKPRLQAAWADPVRPIRK